MKFLSRNFAAGFVVWALVWAPAFALYVWCLAPTVAYTGDCGELIAASWRGGVAHPSGYALYSIAARAWAQTFAWGETAWRYNLFSAFCGASAAGLIALCVWRLCGAREYSATQHESSAAARHEYLAARLWPALLAGWLLAGSHFWGAQCVIAEVYAPGALLMAALIFCALAARQENDARRRARWLALVALGLGLSLNSHLSVVFLWPGLLLFLAPRRFSFTQIFSRRVALYGAFYAALFAIGFSLTLSLPLRARASAEPPQETIGGREYSWWQPLDWGHPADFARWKTHVTVGQYRGLLWQPATVRVGNRVLHLQKPHQSPLQALRRFCEWCALVALQWLWSTPLLLLGAVAAWRPSRRLGALLLLSFVLNAGVAVHYNVDNVFDIANFLFPAYLVLALWLGLGAHWLETRLRSRPQVLALCRVTLAGAVVCQWILFSGAASFRGQTRARDLAFERAAVLETLQQKTGRAPTVFLLNDDTLFPFWYAQHVEGRAHDARTPWGLARRAHESRGALPQLVARFQKQGAVAFANWDETTDARFPFTPLNQSGSLWLASHRALPLPATPAHEVSTRTASTHHAKQPIVRVGFARAVCRRAETSGLEIVFACPAWVREKPLARDARNRARHIGWVEVLVAPRGVLQQPPTDVRLFQSRSVFQSARRLVVGEDARAGQILETLLPLQLPIELQPGEYSVWARLVRTRGDSHAAWRPGAPMQIALK